MKNFVLKFALLGIATMTFCLPAFAWDDAGHKLVAYIAWQQMTPEARANAVRLLLSAPEDSQIAALYPTPPDQDFTTYPIGARSKESKQRDFFMICAYWADIVRDRAYPNRAKYHRGTWHYLDTFWKETNGKVEFLNLPNDKENAVERLFYFDKVLRSDAPDSEKGIALAWVLHIAGDIHQPLHASGRVTDTEPKGDQGGNTFLLTSPDAKPRENLHWYWDSVVVRTVPRRADSSDDDYLLPLAAIMMKKYPASQFASKLESGKFDVWQQESLKVAIDKLYPKSLVRNQMPTAAYQSEAYGIAQKQIATAGYRLGAWLNSIFGAKVAMADAANNIPCKLIRTVGYPVTQTNPSVNSKPTLAVIDLCPKDKGMQQRPMYPFVVNGKVLDFEYDVVKTFKTQAEAKAYATANGITDIAF